jgi:hypothetical protein
MSGAYTMVHHADLNIGSELKRVPNANHFTYVANHIYLCYKTYISRVLLMNIFKQAHPSGYFNFPNKSVVIGDRQIYYVMVNQVMVATVKLPK